MLISIAYLKRVMCLWLDLYERVVVVFRALFVRLSSLSFLFKP